MSDIGLDPLAGNRHQTGLRQRLLRLTASRSFQRWAARFPLTRRITRREGEAIFDLVAGFVHSQCLSALVTSNTLRRLLDGPGSLRRLAAAAEMPTDRMKILLDAGVALGLLRSRRDHYSLTRRGAALTGVPGLADMIAHHRVLYEDLADPLAFFRGETSPELARFWPYVFGAGAADDPESAARYSALMAESQALVAEETLACVNLSGHRHLLDVGGGTGAFVAAALHATPGLTGTLFDLPQVAALANERFSREALLDRATIEAGSFRDDSLPVGADVISLIRVLYDHADDTVAGLLGSAFKALEPGGRLVVSEPMTGGESPTRAGNAYFAIYTLAMETGRTRSPQEICSALRAAGFAKVRHVRTRRPFVTSVVVGWKPDGQNCLK